MEDGNPRGGDRDDLEITSIGALYRGQWDKKYWSASRVRFLFPPHTELSNPVDCLDSFVLGHDPSLVMSQNSVAEQLFEWLIQDSSLHLVAICFYGKKSDHYVIKI
ncbi:hypothetical protein BHE74_00030088 [Ensete ventricosum]|nr:hypothetical protein BHE74_00030088 [Ensete ventricosum]